jgi:hypothetical protein
VPTYRVPNRSRTKAARACSIVVRGWGTGSEASRLSRRRPATAVAATATISAAARVLFRILRLDARPCSNVPTDASLALWVFPRVLACHGLDYLVRQPQTQPSTSGLPVGPWAASS